MSINAIGGQDFGAAQTQQVQGHHGHGHHGSRKAGMDAAAKALGMSGDDLRSALQSGQTLSSLAQSKGISTDSLASTISNALTEANPKMSADRAQQIAQRMVSGPSDGSNRVN
jgi:uncharacterized protein YidB (DUF937 family)